jgi:hypothetical protein
MREPARGTAIPAISALPGGDAGHKAAAGAQSAVSAVGAAGCRLPQVCWSRQVQRGALRNLGRRHGWLVPRSLAQDTSYSEE